jgi:hypothetical protein
MDAVTFIFQMNALICNLFTSLCIWTYALFFQMDAVTCKLFASLCIWTYVLIECSNGVPFNSFLSDEKFTRETGDEDLEQNEQRIREEGNIFLVFWVVLLWNWRMKFTFYFNVQQ